MTLCHTCKRIRTCDDIDRGVLDCSDYSPVRKSRVDVSIPDDPKCTGCGGSLSGNENYCPYCGAEIE